MLLLLKENQMHRLELAMGAGQKWGRGARSVSGHTWEGAASAAKGSQRFMARPLVVSSGEVGVMGGLTKPLCALPA